VAAPCAPWHCVRGPVRMCGVARPFNTIVRRQREMWPIDVIRRRTHDRRLKAALVVFLGEYLVDWLEADQKARIDAEMDANFNRTDTPAVAWRRWSDWKLLAAFRATAMERAGIEPQIAGLSWSELLRPWRFSRNAPPIVPFAPRIDARATSLIGDFRVFDAATIEAKQFLRANGLNIPDEDPPRPRANAAV
jgi:hypothetical protein